MRLIVYNPVLNIKQISHKYYDTEHLDFLDHSVFVVQTKSGSADCSLIANAG